jgi:4a-hydroxytetrahydrobiopterin dehydratase
MSSGGAWEERDGALRRTFEFADFSAAIAFLGRAAGPIDEMDHHPEWTNVYNRVDIRLSSHDVGGVTDRDVQLARVLERLADAS